MSSRSLNISFPVTGEFTVFLYDKICKCGKKYRTIDQLKNESCLSCIIKEKEKKVQDILEEKFNNQYTEEGNQ